MIDAASLITVAVAIIIIYFLAKFIVGPLVKIITGIIIILLAIYILKQFFGIDIGNFLGPLGGYLDIGKVPEGFSWAFNLAVSYINQAVSFFKYLLGNVPKQ